MLPVEDENAFPLALILSHQGRGKKERNLSNKGTRGKFHLHKIT